MSHHCVMGRLLPFLVLADIALVVVALFDCLTSDDNVIRGTMPRIGWVLIIVLLSPIGPIMWFVTRRAEERAPAITVPVAEERPMPVDQIPPDDDPDFLRDLAVRAKEAARLNEAEKERRRDAERRRQREADQRDGQPPAPPAED